jgi:hypothetical protein
MFPLICALCTRRAPGWFNLLTGLCCMTLLDSSASLFDDAGERDGPLKLCACAHHRSNGHDRNARCFQLTTHAAFN